MTDFKHYHKYYKWVIYNPLAWVLLPLGFVVYLVVKTIGDTAEFIVDHID